MYRTLRFLFAGVLLLHSQYLFSQTNPQLTEARRAYDPQGSYVVVVSAETLSDKGWAGAVEVLRKKYDASLIVYPRGKMNGILPELTRLFPRYACFVAAPDEAGRNFVVQVNRLTRRLDSDPYTDLVWGILTGYDSADALRIAERTEPLIIKRAASSMGPGIFKDLNGGFASDEGKKSNFWFKVDGGETIQKEVSPDAVSNLVGHFNTQAPDMFVTSGHATERDWQVYYNIHGGQFLCKRGQLYGLDSGNRRYDIKSMNPKVYLPAGNCLIGHISKPDCMATAWIHTGGAYQMYGYTAVTFFGYMGWGVLEQFGQPWDLADSCYFVNQGLLYELNRKYPDTAGVEFDSYDHYGISKLAAKYGIKAQDQMGYLWDRDILAFYGDPAWIAHKPSPQNWRYDIAITAESVTVTVASLVEGKWPSKPLIIPFEKRMKDFRSPSCDLPGIEPVLTDNFLLLHLAGKECRKGDSITCKFGARLLESEATSAKAKAVVITAGPDDAAPERNIKAEPGQVRLEIPREMALTMPRAFQQAGENQAELISAINESKAGPERDDVVFLINNMPPRDLKTLSKDYLLNNVRLARQARDSFPWGGKCKDDIYRNCVLPYASITEAREDWRGDFFDKLKPVVKDCKSAGEAAVKLNVSIYDLFNVKYHATKRPRPDQGPLESIKAGYASCSGLSVLLVDACRAVGVPARIAGVAQWGAKPESGNHTWVEIMDDNGIWYAIGASESKALNDVWFAKAASEVDAKNPISRVYASTFERGPLRFPFAWDPYADYVSAVDRTEAYRPPVKAKSFSGGSAFLPTASY